MTLGDETPIMEGDDSSSFQVIDFSLPQRDKPVIHPAVDPPVCDNCQKLDLAFFDPNCQGCGELLLNSATTVPEIFGILRQWTPQTQQSLEMLIREVIKRGAHINDRDGLTDMTLLHYASKAGANGVGDIDEACRMVNLLLSKGADVYIRCRWTNMTALHYAVYFDTAPVVKLLLTDSQCIDIDSPCTEFERGTPLHIAAANLAYKSAKCLLENGANPMMKDDLGRPPIDCLPNEDTFEADSNSLVLVQKMRTMLEDAKPTDPIEMSPHYESCNSKVTLQAMGLHLGDKVVVGGVKTGRLRFCGSADFAPGVWAGIELDEPAGKNDGSVGGISYFSCSSKFGIFAPINKISKPGARPRSTSSTSQQRNSISHGKINTSKVTARVDTGLNRRSSFNGKQDLELEIGDRVLVAGQRKGHIKYIGETDFSTGTWYGIELERAVGKNDGSVNGRKYFDCKPKHGVFAPLSRIQKCSDHHGSKESLESFSGLMSEKQRRLSVGSRSDSTQSLHSISSRSRTSINRTPSPSTYAASWNLWDPSYVSPWSSGSTRRTSSSFQASPGDFKLMEGMSVFCNNEIAVVKYIGPVEFAEGTWLGLELRSPRGKNDGSVQGKRYFTCRSSYGLIVRPSKVTVRGINGAKLLGNAY